MIKYLYQIEQTHQTQLCTAPMQVEPDWELLLLGEFAIKLYDRLRCENYDKDSISILKQSSFIDCNYLWGAKAGREVLQCFIAKSASAHESLEPYLLKIPLLVKLLQLIIHDNVHCIWYYSL